MPHAGNPAGTLAGNPSSSSPLTSCLLASLFLLLLSSASFAALFLLFRPRDPTVRVANVHLPSFSQSNGTATFTFAQFSKVRNPNRALFSHYDSTLRLVYRGSLLASMFIPAGQIDAGRTQLMAASFSVPALPLPSSPHLTTVPGADDRAALDAGSVVEVESMMTLKGRVRVLRVFTHHVEVAVGCRVAVDSVDGAVLGFRC